MKRNLKRNTLKERINYSTRTKNIVLVLLVFLFFFTISVGFSFLTKELGLNTNIEIRPNRDIRITNVDGPYLANGAYENGNYQYSHDLLISKGVLPNKDSIIQYKLTITNNGSSDKSLDEILPELLGGVEYRLVDFQIGDEVPAKESVVITIEFYNPTESSITYSGEIKFLFNDAYVDITSPTIIFNPEKDTWFNQKNSEVTISATDDRTVKEFKYCIASPDTAGNVSECTPTIEGNPEGETVTLGWNDGEYKVCVVATDNAKNPNSTTECADYMVDTIAPTIMLNGSNQNQTITVGLGSTFTVPEATVEDGMDPNPTLTTSGNVNTSIDGTYTITYTAKDKAGNTSTLVLTVNVAAPTLQAWSYNAATDFHNSTYKSNIITAEFVTTTEVPSDAVASWDVSAKKNGSVMAWVLNDASNSGKYNLYIGSNGPTYANVDSSNIFSSLYNLKEVTGLENFNTSNVTNMSQMFLGCNSLTSLDLSNFNTSKVTSMYRMFDSCISLTSLDFSNFNTSNVTDMTSMFSNCWKLTELDLSNFNTSNATNMSAMFIECSSLTSLDLNNWNTSNVTNMGAMFSGCGSLTSLDVSNFNTSKVTLMSTMFSKCSNLTSLDLSNFDTSNVTNMNFMFSSCSSLTSLNLSNFDTSNVTTMSDMFSNCSNLKELALNIQNSNANVNNIFNGTTKLHKITMNTVVDVPLYTNHAGCAPTYTTYLGWFDNAEGTGTALTSIPAGSNGTFYAVFEKDKIPPVLTVEGHTADFTKEIELSSTFTIPTATVTDNMDKNPTVTTSGNVNPKVEGTYTVTYTAKDACGNTSTLTMTVKVSGMIGNLIDRDTSHIVKNVVVNAKTVNKVIGTKAEKNTTMKNYVWYSGNLWQVIETTDTSVKMVLAHSITSIPYGSTSDWNSSWVRKWLNEIDSNSSYDGIFYNGLSRTDLILDGDFCLDEVDVTTTLKINAEGNRIVAVPTSAEKLTSCSNRATDKVGILTFEDYVYANNGTSAVFTGGSFLDEDELMWTLTKYTKNTTYPSTLVWTQWYDNIDGKSGNLALNTGGTVGEITKSSESRANTYGLGVRAVINLKRDSAVISGSGTKKDPFIIKETIGKESGTKLNQATIGEYIYLSEENNPYNPSTERVVNGINYSYNKNQVRYRIIDILEDGRIKVERADVLRGLPNTIAIQGDSYVPFYYKGNADSTGCGYIDGVGYTGGCANHNYFNPTDGSGEYSYTESMNLAYYLNNASNSYYNWLSDTTKSYISKTNWELPVSLYGKDYSIGMDRSQDITGKTNYWQNTYDGEVSVNIGLPNFGERYSGNDLNQSYWYINRWQGSSSNVGYVLSHGLALSNCAGDYWYGARPVFHLQSNLVITGGNGTSANPYYVKG